MAMRNPTEMYGTLPALGMTSLVLSVIALLLAFLPVLGIPLAGFGVILGAFGVVAGFIGGASLRWSAAGLVVSLMALGVNFALWYAPEGYQHGRDAPGLWQPVKNRPAVPPPAR
jgi:hypothetical protein